MRCYCGTAACKGTIGEVTEEDKKLKGHPSTSSSSRVGGHAVSEVQGMYREPYAHEIGASLVTRRIRIRRPSKSGGTYRLAMIKAFDATSKTYQVTYADNYPHAEEKAPSKTTLMMAEDDERLVRGSGSSLPLSVLSLQNQHWHLYVDFTDESEEAIQKMIFSIPKVSRPSLSSSSLITPLDAAAAASTLANSSVKFAPSSSRRRTDSLIAMTSASSSLTSSPSDFTSTSSPFVFQSQAKHSSQAPVNSLKRARGLEAVLSMGRHSGTNSPMGTPPLLLTRRPSTTCLLIKCHNATVLPHPEKNIRKAITRASASLVRLEFAHSWNDCDCWALATFNNSTTPGLLVTKFTKHQALGPSTRFILAFPHEVDVFYRFMSFCASDRAKHHPEATSSLCKDGGLDVSSSPSSHSSNSSQSMTTPSSSKIKIKTTSTTIWVLIHSIFQLLNNLEFSIVTALKHDIDPLIRFIMFFLCSSLRLSSIFSLLLPATSFFLTRRVLGVLCGKGTKYLAREDQTIVVAMAV